MIANYGCADGSGEYFITIDTDGCAACDGRPCIAACPKGVFVGIEDDYGDRVIAVKEDARNRLKDDCADCKPVSDRRPLPCMTACPYRAIRHSW